MNMELFKKKHFFDVELAEKIGVNASVLFENISFWVSKNKANDRHYYEGTYWTYNSINAFKELFPYMTENIIRNALKKLEEDGYIKSGNFNQSSYDRTKWYSIVQNSQMDLLNQQKSTLQNPQMEVFDLTNGINEINEPIPYINTYNHTDVKDNTNVLSKKEIFMQNEDYFSNDLKNEKSFQKKVAPKKSFSIPSIEEVRAYCVERQNFVDPEKFHSHYTSVGWKVGKNQMKDWKAAVRTWEKNYNNKANYNGTEQQPQQERFIGRQSQQQVIDALEREQACSYDPRFRE